MVWAGKRGKGTRVDRGAGEELAMSPQPCLAGRGRWVEGTMEDGDSLLHPISAASWDSREPSGILGHSKEQRIHLLWGERSGGSRVHCICRALTRESISSLGSQIPGLLVHGVCTCLHSCLFTESVLEAGLWWTLLSG